MNLLKNKPSELSQKDFLQHYSSIYEHSAWVAESLWSQLEVSFERSCFDTIEAVMAQMKYIVNTATREQKLSLLRAHPDLAGKAALAGELTEDSNKEQAGLGLDQCSAAEYETFQELNKCYKAKFNFPFIMAVKGATKEQVIAGFESRKNNSVNDEFQRAIDEVHKIAGFRLAEK